MHLGNGLIDPPDIPDIGEAVPDVCEKMSTEMKDERKGQETEANKVKKERDQSFGNKSGPEQIHQSPMKKEGQTFYSCSEEIISAALLSEFREFSPGFIAQGRPDVKNASIRMNRELYPMN